MTSDSPFTLNGQKYLLLATLVEILPKGIHEFYGVNLVCTFKGDIL